MNSLNPINTAVLVIDVQTGVFETTPPPLHKQSVLEHINRISISARVVGAPVIFLQHDGDPLERWLVPFTEEWELHPSLQVRPGDLVIRKTACDGFYRTELEGYLRGKTIETIVVMGYATDFCVDTTVRSAASREFSVLVVAEAHTTKDRPVLAAGQIKAHHEWMWVNLICPKGVSLAASGEVVQGFMAAA
jgi:nicotinamidase-related amidase